MAKIWEYKVLSTLNKGVPLRGDGTYWKQFALGLDELGEFGWELCGFSGTILVFKREGGIDYPDESEPSSVFYPARVRGRMRS